MLRRDMGDAEIAMARHLFDTLVSKDDGRGVDEVLAIWARCASAVMGPAAPAASTSAFSTDLDDDSPF